MVYYRWNTVTDNILCEQDSEGNLLTTYTQEPNLYGEVISQNRGGVKSYYHFDGQGSTRALTDENGDVSDTASYAAFGEDVERTGMTENPFGYKGALGYYTNGETGDIYVRARTYEPITARWLSQDPLSTINAGVVYSVSDQRGWHDGERAAHEYAYSQNDAVNANDPSGLCSCCCCPESLTFSKVKLADFGKFRWQLIFRVIASLRMDLERAEPGGMCKIEWYECGAKGGDQGQQPGKWWRAPSPSDDPPGNVRNNWDDPPPTLCVGKFERYWEDTPTMIKQPNERLDIKFAVRITPGTNCQFCATQSYTLYFSLHVKVKVFDNLFPSKSVFDPNPPTLTPGLTGAPQSCTENNIPW